MAAVAVSLPRICLAQAPTGEKIPLSIRYLGHPGSEREADFVAFLKQHFRQVKMGDLPTFRGAQPAEADVVLYDYDGDCSPAGRG